MTIPGGYVAGDILTAANLNLLPAGTVGYAEVTANQTGITTETNLTSLSLTFTAVSGRRYRITGAIDIASSVADGAAEFFIKESATFIGRYTQPITSTSAYRVYVTRVLTPTAGSHTYNLSLKRTTGTGTYVMGANSAYPAYIHIEDVGV